MVKPCSCVQFIKSRIFLLQVTGNPHQYHKSRESPYQLPQVTQEFVSGSYYKSRALCHSIVAVCIVLVLRTRNTTDSSKLVITFGIDLYYGDTYIMSPLRNNYMQAANPIYIKWFQTQNNCMIATLECFIQEIKISEAKSNSSV